MDFARTHRKLTVGALLLSAFISAMEMTVVSTAMPTVIAELGDLHNYAWVFASYILATTVTVPIWGKVADLYGRKPAMLVGLALFLVGSLAAGVAPNMHFLIGARALQGVGAGAMQPISQTILGDMFDAHERARMQGFFGAVWGTAGLVGPLLGGLIVHVLSWRWVFFINLPFGLASMAVLAWAFHERVERKSHALDYSGALLLAAAVVTLLSAGASGVHVLAWPAAALLVVLFVSVERRASEPILPLDMFAGRVIATASIAGALLGAAMTATTTFVPLFVQGLLGGSPTEAGMAIAPMVVGWPLGSFICGRLLPRVGYRPLVRVGFGFALVASVLLALLLGPNAAMGWPRATSFLLGLGLGLANTALLIAVQSSVGWERRGVATASTLLARTLGGTLGVGALGALLTSRLTLGAGVPEAAANSLLGPTHGRELAPEVLRQLSAALAGGLGAVFWTVVALAAAAFVASLWFPVLHVAARAVPPSPAAAGATVGE